MSILIEAGFSMNVNPQAWLAPDARCYADGRGSHVDIIYLADGHYRSYCARAYNFRLSRHFATNMSTQRRTTRQKNVPPLKSQVASAGGTLWDEVTALKRERILAEAADLFYERGYQNTKVDDVAERLGATKQFVYYQFKSKVDLLVEICERATRDALAAIERAVSAEGAPVARFEQFIREFTTVALSGHQMVAVYFREEANLPPEAAARINIMRKTIDRKLRALLQEGVRSGDFEIEDPRTCALLIAGMASYTFAWYRESDGMSIENVTEKIVRVALKIVGPVRGAK